MNLPFEELFSVKLSLKIFLLRWGCTEITVTLDSYVAVLMAIAIVFNERIRSLEYFLYIKKQNCFLVLCAVVIKMYFINVISPDNQLQLTETTATARIEHQ